MSNFKNSITSSSTGHDTFPASATKTGTITVPTTNTTVIGVGTLFTTELQVGGWICDIAHDEIRQITAIKSDTQLAIDHVFTNALAAAALKYVGPSDSVELSVVFAATGKVDGVSFPGNVGIAFSKASRDRSGQRDFVDPIIVDATGTTAYLFQLK